MNKHQKYEMKLILLGIILFFISAFFATEPKGIKEGLGISGIMLSMFYFGAAAQYHILTKKYLGEK